MSKMFALHIYKAIRPSSKRRIMLDLLRDGRRTRSVKNVRHMRPDRDVKLPLRKHFFWRIRPNNKYKNKKEYVRKKYFTRSLF